MPNWVCNHLTIKGENSVEIMKSMLIDDEDSEYGYAFDFNKILPMPKELDIFSQGVNKTCAKLFITASRVLDTLCPWFRQVFNRCLYFPTSAV